MDSRVWMKLSKKNSKSCVQAFERPELNYLNAFKDIVGEEYIDKLHEESYPLIDKHVDHVNSTLYGGGVSILLDSLIILMNELEIRTEWHVIKGTPDFFGITKSIHNALQGGKVELSDHQKEIYLENNLRNTFHSIIEDNDCVIIHDPQPLPLISFYRKKQPWLWRCHIDISNKYHSVWNYLENFITRYDGMIVSMEKYKQDIGVPQYIIPPSIDPFSFINKELKDSELDKILNKYGIERNKPLICQISRFDKWKDPVGVIETFKKARQRVDCKLVLLGNMAQDDPEGQQIYEEVLAHAKGNKDIEIYTTESGYLVNALQRVADIILQKSLREGFALTISEALWKRTPVIGGNVGGIPLQVIDGKTGFLVNNIDECADRIVKLIKDPKLRKEMGANGRQHVKKNFLITRHLMDYVKLLRKVMIHYRC